MKRSAKIVAAICGVALVGLAVAYPEYQRRKVAFYACASHSKQKLEEFAARGEKFYSETNFFFADKGAMNAVPDETRGYSATVVYDIGYTPERLVLRCYVNAGVVSDFRVVGKIIPN